MCMFCRVVCFLGLGGGCRSCCEGDVLLLGFEGVSFFAEIEVVAASLGTY